MDDKTDLKECLVQLTNTKLEKNPNQRKRKYTLNKNSLNVRGKKISVNSNVSRMKHESGFYQSLKKNSMNIPPSMRRELNSRPFKFNLKRMANIRSSKALIARVRLESRKNPLEIKNCFSSEDSLDESPKETSNEISHLLPVIDLLERYNFKYEVMPDTLIKNNGFFLQDKQMNMFFEYYPEYLCIDLLCEIPDLEYDLCLFISVDSNGHCEIVAVGLVKSYNTQGLAWLCEVFRKHNPNWRKIQFIMAGKNVDVTESIKKAFPEKLVFLSLFHALKAFKGDLSNLDKVSTQDVSKSLALFEQMIYTTNEVEYAELTKQIKQLHSSIVTLFRKIWYPKSDSWALGLLFNSKIILKSLNSFLLIIRRKIRPLINNQILIENVIKILNCALLKLKKERFFKFSSVLHTVPTLLCWRTNACFKYSKYLTRYASELVSEQLNILEDVKNLERISPGEYNICGSEIIITINSCSCNFHKLMMLPCSHIFAVRNLLSLPLFSGLLCASRWIASNYQNTYLDLQTTFKCENVEEGDRFKKYFELNQELFPLLIKCPENVSHNRVNILQNLINAWKNGLKISVRSLVKSNYPLCDNQESAEDLCPDYWKEVYGLSLKDILDSDNDFSSVSLCSENPDFIFS